MKPPLGLLDLKTISRFGTKMFLGGWRLPMLPWKRIRGLGFDCGREGFKPQRDWLEKTWLVIYGIFFVWRYLGDRNPDPLGSRMVTKI